MNELRCAAIDCKYNGTGYRCTAKNVVLSESYVMTAHEGHQHFWRCKQYEQSERATEIEQQMDAIMKRHSEVDANIQRFCEQYAKGSYSAKEVGEALRETIRRMSDAG